MSQVSLPKVLPSELGLGLLPLHGRLLFLNLKRGINVHIEIFDMVNQEERD
jgi:hypothetical protein